MIQVTVDRMPRERAVSSAVVRNLVQATLTTATPPVTEARLSFIFCDDEYLRRLKNTFFHRDQYTDVMAFRLQEAGESLEGEIYISQTRARENSALFQESFQREVARLIVHGTLHLLGWEDHTPAEQQAMRQAENRILETVTITSLMEEEL